MKVLKMVMMSTTTMMEWVINTIQKGLKYFLSVPKGKITFHTRDLAPCKKALHALHFCIFVPAPAPVHVSVYRCVCIAELVMVGDATTNGISQITLRMVTVTDLESKKICTHCIFAFFLQDSLCLGC